MSSTSHRTDPAGEPSSSTPSSTSSALPAALHGATPLHASAPWRASTHAMVVAGVGTVLVLAAVLARRPDLLIAAVVLLGAVVPGLLSRPTRPTDAQVRLSSRWVSEGQSITVGVEVEHDRAADALGVDLAPDARTVVDARGGRSLALHPGQSAVCADLVSPTTWGEHRIAGGELRASTAFGVWVSRLPSLTNVTFTATPAPLRLGLRHDRFTPAHLIGRHVSDRPGEGAEFAEIREFRPGDRIRHVHWATSARTGRLHVRTTYAERDAQVLVLLDVLSDIPDAHASRPSSVERSVQAAAHVAGHVIRAGDRVGLKALGDGSVQMPSGSGNAHLQRLLGVLSRIQPGAERRTETGRVQWNLQPGTTVVALTPLTSAAAMDALASLAQQRVDVTVVDVCPPRTRGGDRADQVAWRLLQLEREHTTSRLEKLGIPVVRWDDASAVDQALLRLRLRRQAVGR